MDRYDLVGKGLFPEVLPPCFEASDFRRAIRGFVPRLRERRFRRRSSELIQYSGTKHDGSRRHFATPNPVQYFHVCDFIHEHWGEIDASISSSPFVVSQPKIAPPNADRPVVIPSLSNLSNEASKKLRYSPIIVRADVSQFFPSIYTHVLSWAAHGRKESKFDQKPESKKNYFNNLDRFIQGCQSSETRGLAIGPDAFRIVAEFLAAEIDKRVHEEMGERLVGAARHVDDYFIGVLEESDARYALSILRQCLGEYRLQINDSKTKITNGLEPLNEVWAQRLRRRAAQIEAWDPFHSKGDLALELINFSAQLAHEQKTDSPVKIVLRALDEARIYNQSSRWKLLEPYLQRICFHHAHCIDYVFLLVVKRCAREGEIDSPGWEKCAKLLIERSMALGHEHEVVWSVWLLLCLRIEIGHDLVSELTDWHNQYVNCMLIWAFQNGRCNRKPKIRFGSKIPTEGHRWLEGLVARASGFAKSKFSGAFAEEFEHLASNKLCLVDLDTHMENMKPYQVSAISKTRYGYDAEDEDDVLDLFGFDDELDDELDEILGDPER